MRRVLAGRLLVLGGPTILGLALAGCAHFWDDVTSRDFKVSDLYTSSDPMTVLRTKQDDGDALAKAMRSLKEPNKNHGSEQDQNEAVQILAQAATSDPRPLCRLAAIDAMAVALDRFRIEGINHKTGFFQWPH